MFKKPSRHDAVDDAFGEAMLDAIVGWPDWCHRRVDSIHPLVGERGRIKHSMDCSPPPDPRLAYDPLERGRRRISDVEGQVIVPIARVVKGAMRHLDATDGDGDPLPLLGTRETTAMAVAVLARALRTQGIRITTELRELLQILAGPEQVLPIGSIAKSLAETGAWNGVDYWEATQLPQNVVELLDGFERDFLLAGLIAAKSAGRRQVIKVSFHWSITAEPVPWRLLRPLVAFGLASRSVDMPMTAPRYTSSYHLEFQTPSDLRCHRLQLPDSSPFELAASAIDSSGAPVAHVHQSYANRPRGDARVELWVPATGAWTTSLISCLLTAAIFWLAILLPNAPGALLTASGSAAAILLAAPAVFMGLLASKTESALAAWMLNPLRVLMLVCSLLLFAMAASIVGSLSSPWIEMLWALGAWVSSGLACSLMLARSVGSLIRNVTR